MKTTNMTTNSKENLAQWVNRVIWQRKSQQTTTSTSRPGETLGQWVTRQVRRLLGR